MSVIPPTHTLPDDGKHGVEVLALSAVQGDLDEEFDNLHPLQSVALLQDFRGNPESLLVDHLLMTTRR